MACPVPHLAEDHDLRDFLEYAQIRAMDQPHHPHVDHAYEQALMALKMILEDGCESCIREAVLTLHRACGWPKRRDLCLLLVIDRLSKVVPQ
jgi:hypothetical protein